MFRVGSREEHCEHTRWSVRQVHIYEPSDILYLQIMLLLT